ncbi:hypothetical protein MASR2M79_02550 [Aminivibrio sp.]
MPFLQRTDHDDSYSYSQTEEWLSYSSPVLSSDMGHGISLTISSYGRGIGLTKSLAGGWPQGLFVVRDRFGDEWVDQVLH